MLGVSLVVFTVFKLSISCIVKGFLKATFFSCATSVSNPSDLWLSWVSKLQYTLSFQSLNPPKLIKLTKGSEFLLRSAVMQKKCVNYVSELLLKVLEESKCLKIPYSSRREGCCSGLILLLIDLFLWNAFLFVFKGEK